MPPRMVSASRPAKVGGSGRAAAVITTRLRPPAERAARKYAPASTGPPVRPSRTIRIWPAWLRCISASIRVTSTAVSAGRCMTVSGVAR
ncbi:hypothetical protein ADL15_32025 [Actinoplanes awajinensis subsp. mycoplanecinus]|uniref:Uncharacterized protein n=1 Tax=Actinoplanes awajinensis subsp. mycoplanecinus TaxID=135947 RepID=A0A101JL99_9ACTN|nr:hypothetical protein ADL15_32025 [Actinoplanes awajinensis subsp. mycoplanecinus]